MIFLSVLQHTFQHTEWITKTILEIITKKICNQRIQLKNYNKAATSARKEFINHIRLHAITMQKKKQKKNMFILIKVFFKQIIHAIFVAKIFIKLL